jgi:hypothetical protein
VSGNEVPYSTQMSGISVIYPTGLDKISYTTVNYGSMILIVLIGRKLIMF